MIKDMVIAALIGIVMVQRITSPGDPERPILVMGIAVMALIIILEMEDLWDKHQQIAQRIRDIAAVISKGAHSILRHIYSQAHWYLIRLRTWPIETVQRRRRRQMMQDYILRLRDIQPQERGKNPEEREV